MPGQVSSALERNGQRRTRRIGEIKGQGRTGPDQDGSKQGSGQDRSRPRADQKRGRKRGTNSKRGSDRRSKAREGHSRIMPKREMQGLTKLGQVCT